MLEVRDLKVSYGAIKALHGVNLTVNHGEIVTLIGCNGAGKSTTLRAISGLVRAAAGSITLEGKELTTLAPHEIVNLGMAHSPEGRGIFANMSVRENLELGAFTRPARDPGIAKDMDRVFTLFPRLKERIAQNAGTLSGGEQQMLAIGRSLLARPRILLLDEPSLGLAPAMIAELYDALASLRDEGVTLLLVDQMANLALQVADRAYVLETGRIVKSGSAAELRNDPELEAAYLGESAA